MLREGPPFALIYAAVTAGFVIAYFVVLALVTSETLIECTTAALANLVSMLPFAIVVRSVVMGRFSPVHRSTFVAIIPLLAVGFAIGWYWCLTILLGVIRDGSIAEFRVLPFRSPAAAWQILQGFAVFAAVCALAFAERSSGALATADRPTASDGPAQDPSPRYFIRTGEQFTPIDVDRIISISGADDYAEIKTRTGKHLVKVTLSELEKQLGPNFIRAHRCHIVNVNCVSSLEPAGSGRLSLLLDNGETVQASRTGSKLLRQRLI